jgi:threonine dehydrogenase-like Zn-dependent dehydrogenase
VKAIRFSAPIPTYLVTLAAGSLSPALYTGRHACTRYGDVAEPKLPGEDWVRLRTRLGGVCGSDLAVVTLKASPATSPFSSFPFVLGHENVGEILEVGSAVRGFAVGERVSANPLLSCVPRGIEPPCAECAAGRPARCAHFTDGALPPGMLIGTTRGLGGSWGERFVAHVSQLVRLPENVTDEEAVLIEPLACSVQAVRANLPRAGDRVLVVGGGSIGLLTVAALGAIAPEAPVTVIARHAFQGEQARKLGAARVVSTRGDYLKDLAEAAGARLLRPIIGRRICVGGFDQAYVCVAGSRGMEDAMNLVRAGGRIVLLGNTTRLDGVDWTPLWLKELEVHGSLTYGSHVHAGAPLHAFEEAARLIAGRTLELRPLVTHVFPLADYRRALSVARGKKGAKSIKVAFRP